MTGEQHTPNESLPSFTTTNEAYAHDMYRHTIDEHELDAFLKGTGLYDASSQKWLLPHAPTAMGVLLESVFDVLYSIVDRFVKPAVPGVHREAVNTQHITACQGTNANGYRVCPVVVVQAAGPSFQNPRPRKQTADSQKTPRSLGFGGMATYFVVKLEAELGSERESLDEMKSYARRILKSQPNRFYVRSLMVTEKHARLFHFDRSGSQISPPVNIHEHPATFVRLVAGLSSADERLLGIDDSVQWTIVDGKKDKGTVTTKDATGTIKALPILEEIPIPRDSICSRATTCWRVQDPDTSEELVVKDSWRTDDRPAEHELLELVKGVPGVVQMLSCESGRRETKDLRCISTAGQYQNRVFERVTMKAYSGPIETFKTVLQLLGAIRDAIAGHQSLVGEDIRILHRDVSLHNILLGPKDAPEGQRGVLADLDMAFRASGAQETVRADYNTGTRMFQSLSVLASHNKLEAVRVHDYLDDLESFFYLLLYIFLLYRLDGSRVPEKEDGPSLVREWDDDCPTAASLRKQLIFSSGSINRQALRLVKETWGPVCEALVLQFLTWLLDIQDEKMALLFEGSSDKDCNPFDDLHSHRDQHYSEVLALFDNAIEVLKTSAATTIESTVGECSNVSANPSAPKSVQSSSASDAAPGGGYNAFPTPAKVHDCPPTLKDQASSVSCPDTTTSSIPTAPPSTSIPPPGDRSTSSPHRQERSEDEARQPSPQLQDKQSIASSNTASTPPTTPPTSPPRAVLAILSNQSSPSSPGLKRRSEDAVHPESPLTKTRRLKTGLQSPTRSP